MDKHLGLERLRIQVNSRLIKWNVLYSCDFVLVEEQNQNIDKLP